MIRTHIVIPARLASTRLPEKLLLTVAGKSVLRYTHEAASRSRVASGITVAVDDARLAREVESFGGRWVMTSPACPSGTDRLAEVARTMADVDVFVNVQGDEPEIDSDAIDLVAQTLIDNPWADIATAARPIRDAETLSNPNVVKVVLGLDNRALYFSRASIGYARDGLTKELLEAEPPTFWHHVGLYAYRRDFLEWFAMQGTSPLERIEKLEQLRALEHGRSIAVARIDASPAGIDTQADFDAFVGRLAE